MRTTVGPRYQVGTQSQRAGAQTGNVQKEKESVKSKGGPSFHFGDWEVSLDAVRNTSAAAATVLQ
jgi:hypothetical protein